MAQRTADKTKLAITQINNYEQSIDMKIGMQTDFIQNKVIIEVAAFENGQGEGSKMISRLAVTA